MNTKNILILESGHLGSRIKLLVIQKGLKVTHLPNLY